MLTVMRLSRSVGFCVTQKWIWCTTTLKTKGFALALFDFLIYSGHGLNLRSDAAFLCNLIISMLVVVQQQVKHDKKFRTNMMRLKARRVLLTDDELDANRRLERWARIVMIKYVTEWTIWPLGYRRKYDMTQRLKPCKEPSFSREQYRKTAPYWKNANSILLSVALRAKFITE